MSHPPFISQEVRLRILEFILNCHKINLSHFPMGGILQFLLLMIMRVLLM
uniref:Uncharacterized protein n=1 Tax=Amphimedon queenslandica TaxID=400682 RepID=A0A1X7UEK8_AMPQE